MFRTLFAWSALLAVVVVGKEPPAGRPPKKEIDPNWQPNPFKPAGMVPENRLPEKGGFGDQPDAFMNAVEVYWLIPCTDALPEICHGLCNTLPAVFGASMVVGTVALLSYFEKRDKTKAAAAATKKSK